LGFGIRFWGLVLVFGVAGLRVGMGGWVLGAGVWGFGVRGLGWRTEFGV
jgi:hypothetical protein